MRDKLILSLEKITHKDYDRKSSFAKEEKKNNLVVSLKGLGAKKSRLAINRQS
jgi:hypothetical protein